MKYNIFGYLIGEGFSNVFKKKKSTGASLMIMCATMLVFGLFFVIGENINAFVENVAEAQEIRVNLKINATESEIEEVGNEILAIDGVKSGRSTSVLPSLSKNLYRSLDGVVPISFPKILKNSNVGV